MASSPILRRKRVGGLGGGDLPRLIHALSLGRDDAWFLTDIKVNPTQAIHVPGAAIGWQIANCREL
jgi:hypothetical protein